MMREGGSHPDRFTLPSPGAPTPVQFPAIERSTLTSGLQVWTLPHATIPVVSVALVVRAGAAHDPASRHGLASLTAHMADEGAGDRDAIQLAEALALLGTHLDADTGSDVTTVSFTALRRCFEPALGIVGDVVTRPHFDEAGFARVRELRLSRLRQLSRSPATPADRAYLTAVFKTHPYGHGVLGTSASLSDITLEDVRAFHREMWRPDRSTLIVAGAINHDLVVKTAETAFVRWSHGTAGDGTVATVTLPEPASSEILLVERPGAAQSELRVGHTAPPRRTPAYHALVTLNRVLGGDFSSRINRNLREAKGLTYGAHSTFDFRRAGGSFVVQTSVQTSGTATAISEILRECDAIRADGAIEVAELERARSALTRGYVRNFESSDDLVRAAAQLAAYDLDDQTFDRFVPLVEGLTPEQVTAAARVCIRPDALKIIVAGEPDLCRPQLESLGRRVSVTAPEF
jgi:zinc protease